MSAISEKVRTALYTAMNVSGVTDLATGGIYWEQADEGALRPYLIFDRQAAGQPIRAMGQSLLAEDDLWIIKGYADADSDATKDPHEVIQEMLGAVETAVGETLTLSSGVTWLVERYSDLVLPREVIAGRTVHAGGFLMRIVAT